MVCAKRPGPHGVKRARSDTQCAASMEGQLELQPTERFGNVIVESCNKL